ncbi:MAG: type III pantothenate kinase [Bacteroidetes bacterium]|nr:MAG: type III pantothenate kinase [Bacteroidota bacterium]
MLLVFDIGNSRTKIGLFHRAQLLSVVSFDTMSTNYVSDCKEALRLLATQDKTAWKNLSGIAIASVVPSHTKKIEIVCKAQLKKKPLVISARLKTGLTISYAHPLKLGSDRLCNAVAAYHRYKQAVIVVDWGTATKFDVVDRKGAYLGGAIAPGLGASAQLLAERTAQLPRIQLEFPPTVIGKDTVQCLQSGILYGIIEMTRGMLSRIKKEIKQKPMVVATGGFSSLLSDHISNIDAVEPHLVLEGVTIIYKRNRHHH